MDKTTDAIIMSSHGSGGKASRTLIDSYMKPLLTGVQAQSLSDGALLPKQKQQLVLTTDSYVIYPHFFV